MLKFVRKAIVMTKVYVERLMESVLRAKLNSCGCVLVTGPKFSGKSTMCLRYAKSVTELKTENDIEVAKIDPKSALKGKSPHLIDEWQKSPDIWNQIKKDLDDDYVFGKYIITGSTTPLDPKKIQHSGAGRIASMVLRPFTLYESGESSGIVSLKDLLESDGANFAAAFEKENPVGLDDIAFYICRGGWPIALKAKKEYAVESTRNYFEGLFRAEDENDDFGLFLKNKNIDLLKLILKSYARNISSQAKKTKMIADILASGIRSKLDEDTFSFYEKTLKDLFLIFDLPAWNLNLRSSAVVRSAPTHHFFDPSIAAASLGISPNDLLNDMHSFGLFFEDLVIRDLSVYASTFGAAIKHYRDSSGQEIDAVVESRNGEYGVIEIKLASEENIEEGAASLNRFEKKLRESELKLPKFKMIITSNGTCSKRKDDIYVVPLTCLKN